MRADLPIGNYCPLVEHSPKANDAGEDHFNSLGSFDCGCLMTTRVTSHAHCESAESRAFGIGSLVQCQGQKSPVL